MNNITEDMYMLAKKVTHEYEKTLDNRDVKSRAYSYQDMKASFSAGLNRGCYVASVISNNLIDSVPTLEEFLETNYNK